MLPRLLVITGSTRPVRVGPAVAAWFADVAESRGDLEVERADLAEVGLPLLDEPRQALSGHYEHAHTRAWAAVVARANAVAFVVPEYNHSFNAATKNAIDYLYHEWRHKPFAVVSYGGQSRGLRAGTALRTVLTSLAMIPAGDVGLSLQATPVREGTFEPDEAAERAAERVLDEIALLAPLTMGLGS